MEARGVWAAEGLGMSSDCSFFCFPASLVHPKL